MSEKRSMKFVKSLAESLTLPANTNTMWRKLLYSGFHTPKAVTYHEPTVIYIVHDRSQPWAYGDVFWPQHPQCWDPISKHISNPDVACKPFKVLGSDIKTHLEPRLCLQAILKKRGRDVIICD